MMSVFACGFNGFSQITSTNSSYETSSSSDVLTPLALDKRLFRCSECSASSSTASLTEQLDLEPCCKRSRVSPDLKNVAISWDRISYLWKNGKVTSFGGPGDNTEVPFEGVKLSSVSVCCQNFLGVNTEGNCLMLSSQLKALTLELKQNDDVTNKGDFRVSSIYSCENGTVILHHDDSLISIGELEREFCVLLRPLSVDLRIKSVSCGKHHVLLVSVIGVIFSHGNGSQGQLGHGTISNEATPRILEALEGVSILQVAAGGWHSMALSDIGDIYVWGWNEKGQLGFPCRNLRLSQNDIKKQNPDMSSHNFAENCLQNDEFVSKTSSIDNNDDKFVNVQPLPLLLDLPTCNPSEAYVSKIACGSRHSAAVLEDGTAFSWGFNFYGQLGHGDTLSRDYPEAVGFFREHKHYVEDVFCGFWNTLFVTRDDCN